MAVARGTRKSEKSILADGERTGLRFALKGPPPAAAAAERQTVQRHKIHSGKKRNASRVFPRRSAFHFSTIPVSRVGSNLENKNQILGLTMKILSHLLQVCLHSFIKMARVFFRNGNRPGPTDVMWQWQSESYCGQKQTSFSPPLLPSFLPFFPLSSSPPFRVVKCLEGQTWQAEQSSLWAERRGNTRQAVKQSDLWFSR